MLKFSVESRRTTFILLVKLSVALRTSLCLIYSRCYKKVYNNRVEMVLSLP